MASCGVGRVRRSLAGSPVCVVVGVVSHAPIRYLPGGGRAMTVTPGTGLLSQDSERGQAGSCGHASSPGAGDPPG
jgi:hypothetical protein